MSFQINDAVYVSRDNRQLEGVIAYIGTVDFAEGDDWVGIRLTGASVGLGKNNGSVQDRSYFECPPQCGLFVKRNLVTKRQLTRLEELRLKRELATSSSTDVPPVPRTPGKKLSISGPTGGSTTTTPSRPPSGTTTPPPPSSSSATSASVTSATTTATRLEEIRQRRAQLAGRTPTSSTGSLQTMDNALAAASGGSSHNASTSDMATTTATGSDAANAAILEDLQSRLKEKETELETLQQELSQQKQQLTLKDKEIQNLQDKVLAVQQQQQVEPTSKTASPTTGTSGSDYDSPPMQDLLNQLERLTQDFAAYQKDATQKMDQQSEQLKDYQVQLTKAKAESEELQKELANVAAQNEIRGSSDASHYKERAKLQAEVASLNRRVEQLELDKQELENTVEELALDKEQLQEEKEGLEDRYEELKLDTETAQMEVEELRMELEQAKAQQAAMVTAAAATSTTTTTTALHEESVDGSKDEAAAQDIASNLSIQNARLREALIRLREQSSVQQMDMSRQLRAAEKQAEEGRALANELQTLRNLKTELEEQISDLKDMVEQGSAYEVMVEDLSDRVLSLEEELVASQQMIRELEEAADITAEMEEVQTEELKALNRDLEDRETVIRNLEEAIKMQRKREEDFQRTVSNYRATVETLKQEKKALLELQQGGEGEKSDLVSASQKALARAAQLVQDAAEMRKREAQAAIDRIDSQVRLHLSERLESMLPPSVAASEIASIKGELLLSKVVGKASLSLDGIARSFSKTIRARAWEWRSEKGEENEGDDSIATPLLLTEEQQQTAATMIHQSEVAHVAIDVSGDLLWLLSAGQWPDIVSPDASAELGAIMGHTMNDLDVTLGNVLNTLKEEGVLSPHQSNIGAFRQTVVATMQTLRTHIEHDGESLVPMHWKPPALRLFRDASRAKYSSMGCFAAVASVLNYGDNIKTPEMVEKTKALVNALKRLLRKLDKSSAEASKSCLRLATLDVQDDSTVADISGVAQRWRAASDDLLGNIFRMMSSDEGITPDQLQSCEAAADEVLRLVSQFAAVLRTANLNVTEDHRFHPFSPEVADVWEGVTLLARSIRSQDGDVEDVNYLIRARAIEQSLEQAVEKEPKLALANAKVASLEKSLSLRSKEIAMQNTRLSELEKLLARTSAQPATPLIKSAELTSSEEINNLKQENRVLTEAMDVLHRQVEEYESEIRFLKDTKSPSKSMARGPRRSYTSDALRESRSGGDLQAMSSEAHAGAFEAALFRPALQAARRDAAHWRTKATISTLLELPPLTVLKLEEEKSADDDGDISPFLQLSSALANYRTQVASIKVVDLTKPSKSPRAELYSMLRKKAAAAQQLDEAAASARRYLERHGSVPSINSGIAGESKLLVGRVKFAGAEPVKKIPTSTTLEDLHRIQLHMVR